MIKRQTRCPHHRRVQRLSNEKRYYMREEEREEKREKEAASVSLATTVFTSPGLRFSVSSLLFSSLLCLSIEPAFFSFPFECLEPPNRLSCFSASSSPCILYGCFFFLSRLTFVVEVVSLEGFLLLVSACLLLFVSVSSSTSILLHNQMK